MDITDRPTGPRVFLADRREGKTTQALAWLLNGQLIDTYPGWSRALVCVHKSEAQRLELQLPWHKWRKAIIWIEELDSFSRATRPGTVELAIDDAQALVSQMIRQRISSPVDVALMTFDGRPYEPADDDAIAHATSLLNREHRCEPGTCPWAHPAVVSIPWS
jgi:hypothetical protein